MASLLRTAAVSATLHFKFLDFRLDVETNSLRAASRLQAYFRSYLAPPGGRGAGTLSAIAARPAYDAGSMREWGRSNSARPPKESYYDRRGTRYILKNRTGVLIEMRPQHATITGDIDRYVNQVVNLIATLFGLSLVAQGYSMVHASAVVNSASEETLVFLGNSGSGKSSLALQLIEAGGYDYLSNDRVLMKVRPGGVHVVGLPKKPRVNPGTLLASKSLSRLLTPRKRPIYEQMPPAELWGVEDKYDVDVGRVLGARERLSGTLSRVYSLEWKQGGTGLDVTSLAAEGALEALRATAKDFGAFDVHREAAAEPDHSKLIKAVEFLRVTGMPDPRALARRLR